MTFTDGVIVAVVVGVIVAIIAVNVKRKKKNPCAGCPCSQSCESKHCTAPEHIKNEEPHE